ncbi:alpha-2-macroglobulin-like [Echeneis naucrates]|uniref:alpha-2-macroglobulin-like n=1 Tax=Echeneis naucrates TaxID=173247 RepID=UPI0011133238|nr:alpha-2-macroglobulin-like [Echeneis naucrates]
MGLPGSQMWTWTLCVLLSWMCGGQVLAEPKYMVAVPAVLESGVETRFCVSLLDPNETLHMTVSLVSEDVNRVLLKKTASEEFHTCSDFTVPVVEDQKVLNFEVEVRGDNFFSKEVRKVMSKVYEPMTFVQTDKPIYLPGQTVHFRVITLDPRLRPASRLYDIIEIEDTHDNRIGQWLNQTSDGKILQLSYDLNSEAQEGMYQVIVSIGNNKIYHSFKVEKYVLPKFDVTTNVTETVSIEQEDFEAKICAKYTYGQPLPGDVEIEVCRPFNRYMVTLSVITPDHPEGVPVASPPCHKEKKKTDSAGCAAFTVPMSPFTKLDPKAYLDHLSFKAHVEEEGTGVIRPEERRIQITYIIGTLSFVDTPKIYEEGETFEGKVKAVHYNNTPVPDMKLYLFTGEQWSAQRLQNLTTDSEGVAAFSLSTAEFRGDIQLHVSSDPRMGYVGYKVPYFEAGHHLVSMNQLSTPHTKIISFLEVKKHNEPLPCGQETDITIRYTVVGEEQGSAHVMYLILSRGAIVTQGFKELEVQANSVNEGEVSFKLNVNADMAPEVQVLAYAVLPSTAVIADSADFSTEKCFSHKVSLEFSPSLAVPGEETTMQVTAQPKSLCGLSAVDQSVLIKEPGKTLNAEKIYSLLPVTKASYIPYEVEDPSECLHVRPRRYVLPYPTEKDDTYTTFQNVGIKMATNLFVRMPSCLKYKGREYHYGHYVVRNRFDTPVASRMSIAVEGAFGGSAPYSDPPPIETVRTFFPETWIWDLVEVGESGRTDVALTVPDTITTWETEAFCLSPQGFGLAPRKEITVFQPFFLELTMPYSIIRGESFELKATVFNYLTSCIMVSVSPTSSSDYTLTPLSGDQYKSCLCGNQRRTVSWTMDPSALGVVNVTVSAEAIPSHISCDNEIVSVPERGRIDVVTRSLIVKAEGTEMTDTHNWLLCPKEESLTAEVNLQLPENVIDGSARASISVLGDILGRALKNVDGLLKMPYGCGEQNMALLAPNIYILEYLKNTHQLTPAIQEKASKFLRSGYQRQLNYKHGDGAYSTFGVGEGNTWLTAFVMRSFARAQAFIYIEPKIIEESKSYLMEHRHDNGCFQKIGKLFNNRMKGGVSDDVTLSAYITAALLEMKIPITDRLVNKSLSCLRESISDFSNTYTTALMAYAFTLAGDTETRDQLLKHLDKVSIRKGGLLHWSQEADDTSASLSVEISSYVLLAKLSASPTTEDLGYASNIVRWLTGQQNSYGGFSSTQDTVVALQALALYSTLVFSPGGSSTVTVQAPSTAQLTFDVNQNNKLLYQEESLPEVTGKYGLEVKGSACASLQINLHYNVPTPTNVTTLSIAVAPEALCSTMKTARPKLLLKLKSLYSGKENTTNMVIVDIKMLSGFVPDADSLKRLGSYELVDRVERKQDHVLVYLQELPKDTPISYSLQLNQELPVKNLKPAVVKIYDYYQPNDQSETQYIYPCVAGRYSVLGERFSLRHVVTGSLVCTDQNLKTDRRGSSFSSGDDQLLWSKTILHSVR